ncbi:hypothetical protein [Tunicatimonas pelagia]|uniref:hypothetical protein n=1 Tax=Tunicatimonas pelagia TaxID=931531 RepID=UPI002665C80A|nr:hypothetical protein [Tunicatimonas pelagia]WKN43309.1 hypothetical protein P0M28_30150 [Tunicatimonas pelagia]
MHTNTNFNKSIKIKGISVPAILFLAGMVAGYYISSGDTFSLESDEEYTNKSIYYSDSGQFSFPVFALPF